MRKRRPVSGGAVLEFEITIGTRKENQLLCYKAIFQLSSLCDLVLQSVLNSALIQGRYLLDVLQTGLIIQKQATGNWRSIRMCFCPPEKW